MMRQHLFLIKMFAGADTYATGLTLSRAIRTVIMPDFDLIIMA